MCQQQDGMLELGDGVQLSGDKKQKIYDKALGAIKHWLERFDTIIIGPGLGRDEMVHYVVKEVSAPVFLSSQSGQTCCPVQPHVRKVLTPPSLG